ncbi:hypothetical protein [Amycolatopsis pithecellobii]|uniref:Uncharacterized protein n=1 Tax=Amycolatopsis pithecellobii TaxID=664692 RepID=A0A6N7YJD2_9PSEU|nr:hypothetical protein [Amycolatopsis pithecellobii]MTD53015.1 hypothetical protein [Amycolatopsis pithecellobii]
MVSDGAESTVGEPVPGLTESGAEKIGWRPRWWLFGVFVALAAIHLSDGWTSTAAIGLPVGFGCTLILVFVRRVPPWLTGEWSPRPWSRSWLRARGIRLSCVLLPAWLPAAAVVGGMVEHPPHGVDVLYAAFGLACALGLAVFVLVRWARTVRMLRVLKGPWTPFPVRANHLVADVTGTVSFPDGTPGYFVLRDCPPALAEAIEHAGRMWITAALPGSAIAGFPGSDDFARVTFTSDQFGMPGRKPRSRAALGLHLRIRTFVLATVVVLGVALETAAVITVGGVLPWVLPVLVLLAVAAAVNWRWDVTSPARLLAAGPWTEVAAAVVAEDFRPGRPMLGWARFPDGMRARFRIVDCPADIAAELMGSRRLWIAGEPHAGAVATGIPDGDTFAIAEFSVKTREYRRPHAPRPATDQPSTTHA